MRASAAVAASLAALLSTLPWIAPAAAGADAPARFPPLEAESWIVPLVVPGFADALVAVPVGSREPRAVIVALHGNYDRPEWACGSWRGVAGPDPFVLCPRGKARSDAPADDPRFTYPGADAAAREVHAALEALRARFGPRVAEGPMVYAGFSLGAIVGVPLVSREASTFSRVALVEGGQSAWTAERARQFHAGGGDRVLFVCSQPGCLVSARAASPVLERAGVNVRIVSAGNHGHTYDGAVAAATKTAWPWLVEGLRGF